MDPQRILWMVPTELERRRLLMLGGDSLAGVDFQLCGFGPILAAVSATRMLGDKQYDHVLLCGIAGAYPESPLEPGCAICVSNTMLDAIGVVENGRTQTGQHLGFSPALPDCFELSSLIDGATSQQTGTHRLLTVCTASHDSQQAANRQRLYQASVEDMEGYGVAAACYQYQVPLTIVRGISNIAGDREKSRWCIDAALQAVAQWIATRLRYTA